LRPDNWSLLLLDEASRNYISSWRRTASTALKDVRVKMGRASRAGWRSTARRGGAGHLEGHAVFSQVDEKTKTETQSIVAVPVKFRDTCLA